MGAYKAKGGLSKAHIMAIDEAVDSWSKGRLTNKEFRLQILSLGAEVFNERIGKNDSSENITIAFPDGTTQTGWNKGGAVNIDYRKKGLFK